MYLADVSCEHRRHETPQEAVSQEGKSSDLSTSQHRRVHNA